MADRLGETYRFDGGDRSAFVLETHSGRRLKVSHAACTILELRWAGADWETIAHELAAREIAAAEPDRVRMTYETLIARIEALEAEPVTSGAHALRTTLLPQPLVARIARRLEWLYTVAPAAAVAGVVLAAAAYWFTVMTGPDLKSGLNASALVPGYALFFVSLLAHEFGHAAACSRFGAKPGEIGFTLYAIFPALFSDVSSAWRLPRRDRVIVDLGGIYVQLLAMAGYAGAYALTHWAPLKLAILLALPAIVFNLNPFMKFDGYWVLTDALGVTNLQKQRSAVLRKTFGSWSGIRGALRGTPAQRLLLGYAVLTVGAWTYCIVAAAIAFRWNADHLTGLLAAMLAHRTVVNTATAFQLLLLAVSMMVLTFAAVRALGQVRLGSLLRRLSRRDASGAAAGTGGAERQTTA